MHLDRHPPDRELSIDGDQRRVVVSQDALADLDLDDAEIIVELAVVHAADEAVRTGVHAGPCDVVRCFADRVRREQPCCPDQEKAVPLRRRPTLVRFARGSLDEDAIGVTAAIRIPHRVDAELIVWNTRTSNSEIVEQAQCGLILDVGEHVTDGEQEPFAAVVHLRTPPFSDIGHSIP
jgi:hypothetical protein